MFCDFQFGEKLRKDREEMERKAREEAEKKRAAEIAAQQKLQQQKLQQQQQAQLELEQAAKKMKKKSKHKEDSQIEQPKENGPKCNAKNETVRNNNKSIKVQESNTAAVNSNNKKNLKNKSVSPIDAKQQNTRASPSYATPKSNQSSLQTNINTNSRAPGEPSKKNTLKSQQLQGKQEPQRSNNSPQRQAETRRKPDGASAKEETPKQDHATVSKVNKKQKQPVIQSNGKVTKLPETPNHPTPQQSRNQVRPVQAAVVQQESKQNGGTGGGSKLGLNLALQATARALERKRDFLQKQKQQAEQESQEGKTQSAVPQTQQEPTQIPKNKIVGKAKKTNTNQQPSQQHSPATPTKHQRQQQQMVNNVMNTQPQSSTGSARPAPEGMKLPVQKPATPPHIMETHRVTQENHVNTKPRIHQQMNGTVPQQQVQRMMNGNVTPTTPRTPEKKMVGREPIEIQREQPTTPLKDHTNDKTQRNDTEVYIYFLKFTMSVTCALFELREKIYDKCSCKSWFLFSPDKWVCIENEERQA